jgi:hypothetical protein
LFTLARSSAPGELGPLTRKLLCDVSIRFPNVLSHNNLAHRD